jgi:hypothetical protein
MDMKKPRKLLRSTSWYLLLFFTMFISTRCSLFCNDEEKVLFDPYDHPLIQEGDILKYVGDNTLDSFRVARSHVYEPYEDGSIAYDHYVARIYNQKVCNSDTCMGLYIYISNSMYSLRFYNPLQHSTEGFNGVAHIPVENGNYSIQIGDSVLSGLYLTVFLSYPDEFREIDSVLYSKTYGIVKYYHYTGEEFVLSEESLALLMARE